MNITGKMRLRKRLLSLAAGLCLATSVVAAEKPKHAFNTSYEQMMEELPNVKNQMRKSEVDGHVRWLGNLSLGTSAAVVQIDGWGEKDAVTGLTVLLFFNENTATQDYDRAEALRDVLIQTLIGKGEAFESVNNFFADELARQQPIILAGGTPKRGVTRKASLELSVEIARPPQGLMAIYNMKLI